MRQQGASGVLGGGGQGTVSAIPGTDRVVKHFNTPTPRLGLREFDELVARGAMVRNALDGSRIDLVWPDTPRIGPDGLEGYEMPRIRSDYYTSVTSPRGTTLRECQLMYAVPRASQFTIDRKPTDSERIMLLVLVARFLQAMHAHDLVYGDISWANFVFALDPVRLCVLDFDSTRVIGSPSFTRAPAPNTVDWDDPTSGGTVALFDSDRFKFALLVHRLLIAGDHFSSMEPALAPTSVPGLDTTASYAVVVLLRRAAGPAGTRPTIAEWLHVLDRGRP